MCRDREKKKVEARAFSSSSLGYRRGEVCVSGCVDAPVTESPLLSVGSRTRPPRLTMAVECQSRPIPTTDFRKKMLVLGPSFAKRVKVDCCVPVDFRQWCAVRWREIVDKQDFNHHQSGEEKGSRFLRAHLQHSRAAKRGGGWAGGSHEAAARGCAKRCINTHKVSGMGPSLCQKKSQ